MQYIDCIILCGQGCLVHCRIFSSIWDILILIQIELSVLHFHLLNLATLIENELTWRAGFSAGLCRNKYGGR